MPKSRRRRAAARDPRRTKRASAEELYRTCKAAGTCPPDVIPKIEGDTIADQLLKYGSSAVYFGGLGIGTGSGSGGRTGYVPLRPSGGGGVVRGGGRLGGGPIGGGGRANLGIPLRPPEVVDEVVTISPEGPSVIGNESTVVRPGAEVSVTEDVVGVTSGPNTVTVPDTTGSSVITTQSGSAPFAPSDTAPETVSVSHSQFGNPAYTGEVSGTGETSFMAHTSIVAGSGRAVQGEAIELQTFPQASTPVQQVTRGATFNFYTNYTQQVYVGDPRFLYAPQDLFTYENPAFDTSLFDASTTIAVDPAELPSEAPDPAFYDVFRLHRPALSAPRAARGRVRFSRLGDRLGSVFTRSGANVGGRAHFFTDLSSIGAEDLEMQSFSAVSSTSGESSLITASGPLGPDEIPLSTFTEPYYNPDADLDLPTVSVSASGESEETYFLRPTGGGTSLDPPPAVAPSRSPPTPKTTPTHTTSASNLLPPESSDFGGYTVYSDYYYDPSLWRKRKRKQLPFFFTDAILAA
nr:MAG: L2 protein [Leptonychotes weddellii papillomavirus 12]